MIKTKHKVLPITLGIWAMPSSWPDEKSFPFDYEVTTSVTNHWRQTAILVAEIPTAVVVPEGVDLHSKALATLDVLEKAAMDDYTRKLKDIDDQRRSLMLLSAPTGDYIEHEQ